MSSSDEHDKHRGRHSDHSSDAGGLDVADRVKAGIPLTFDGPTMAKPRKLRHIDELIEPALENMDRRHRRIDNPISTPWDNVNTQLRRGLWPGLHMLTASPGAGKTAFAFQVAKKAAKEGTPVIYVGLELDEDQSISRLAGGRWSDRFVGEIAVEKEAIRQDLKGLPIYFDIVDQWRGSYLDEAILQVYESHPNSRTVLCIVDFLQLVDAEEGTRSDLRETIKTAAYSMRRAARTHRATVLAVSSTARENYTKYKESDLATDLLKGGKVARKGKLLGMGKESGDIDYAADSANVLLEIDYGLRVFVTAKLRYGFAQWCALSFDQQGFQAIGRDTVEDTLKLSSAGKAYIAADGKFHANGASDSSLSEKDLELL